MNKTMKLLPAIVLAGAAAVAQQQPFYVYQASPAYEFKTVLSPQSDIGGYTFGGCLIGSTAINDAGEVAFVAHWENTDHAHNGVFTLHRLVALEGDPLFFTTIGQIAPYGHLAISPRGIVAFEGSEAGDTEMSIFVERQALMEAVAARDMDLALNDQDEPTLMPHASAHEGAPFSMVPANRRGQFIVAINTAKGPYLIVGTPK